MRQIGPGPDSARWAQALPTPQPVNEVLAGCPARAAIPICFTSQIALEGHRRGARSLSTPFDRAERITTLYGRLDSAASEDQGMVAYTLRKGPAAGAHSNLGYLERVGQRLQKGF